jgi:hypothetical protein
MPAPTNPSRRTTEWCAICFIIFIIPTKHVKAVAVVRLQQIFKFISDKVLLQSGQNMNKSISSNSVIQQIKSPGFYESWGSTMLLNPHHWTLFWATSIQIMFS